MSTSGECTDPGVAVAGTGAPGANRNLLRAAAAVLVIGIFLVDALTPLQGAVAVLYVVAVLIVAPTARRADIIVTAAAAIVLTLLAYSYMHGFLQLGSSTLRAFVSLAAIVITALLALRNLAAVEALESQAMLLDLSHDMIFVRDARGAIGFWNRTAEETYGWTAHEARGRVADELLRTRYPQPRAEIEAALRRDGAWTGTLEQTTRSGRRLVLDSRWVLQCDDRGRPLRVMETHTDVTDREAAHAALVRSERRYRRMFEATRIGVVSQDWTGIDRELAALGIRDAAGLRQRLAANPDLHAHLRRMARIVDANPAFLRLVAGGDAPPPASVDELLAYGDATFVPALEAYLRGDAFHEGETVVLHADGTGVPVIFTISFPRRDDEVEVMAFVVDISEREQARHAVLAAQSELAHAARAATLGELAASIAHEVNQPLMAVVTNGEAGLRWLRRDQPELGEAEAALERIVGEGRRAGEILGRIRAFLAKAPAQRCRLEVATVVGDALRLVEHELARAQVRLQVRIAPDLPAVHGDRIQLQQVLVNLLVNASQAMAGQARERRLEVSASRAGGGIEIVVADSGPGIPGEHLERLFEPFFSTRKGGMGMGLAICRRAAEAHGGQLGVLSVPGEGASFILRLVPADGASP